MRNATRHSLYGMLRSLGIVDKPDRIAFARAAGVDVDSFARLSEEQAEFLCEVCEALGPKMDP